MRSSNEHHWRFTDDVVAAYLAFHGDKLLGQSLEQASITLGITKRSMKMRVSNILGILTKCTKQSGIVRDQYRGVPEPELRAIALGILMRAAE